MQPEDPSDDRRSPLRRRRARRPPPARPRPGAAVARRPRERHPRSVAEPGRDPVQPDGPAPAVVDRPCRTRGHRPGRRRLLAPRHRTGRRAQPLPDRPVTGSSLATPTPTPTSVPSVVPPSASPTITAPPTAVPGVALPADFQPRSVTFASPTEGWVLGSTACAAGRCAVIAHTLDAGRSWSRINAPTTTVDADARLATSGVSALRFADPLDGWAYGPDLWATHDGGTTWTQVRPLRDRPVAPLRLGPRSRRRHGSLRLLRPCVARLRDGIHTRLSSDAWSSPPVYIPVGAGPVPQVQLVIQGSAGWLVEVDREVVDGARLVNGAWQSWTPPCSDTAGPALLAAWSTKSARRRLRPGRLVDPAG